MNGYLLNFYKYSPLGKMILILMIMMKVLFVVWYGRHLIDWKLEK